MTWPRCFYDPNLKCGDPATGKLGYDESSRAEVEEKVRRKWHVADMCNCPSCPLRVRLAQELREQE